MRAAFHSFSTPPARQANERLAGIRGDDLPLTAFFRRHSGTVNAAAVASAIVGAAAFLLPFLLAL